MAFETDLGESDYFRAHPPYTPILHVRWTTVEIFLRPLELFNSVPSTVMDAQDVEKVAATESSTPVESSSFDEALKPKSAIWRKILGLGVEENGIIPVPVEKRTDKRVFNLFTLWLTALLCLLPYVMIARLGNWLSLMD